MFREFTQQEHLGHFLFVALWSVSKVLTKTQKLLQTTWVPVFVVCEINELIVLCTQLTIGILLISESWGCMFHKKSTASELFPREFSDNIHNSYFKKKSMEVLCFVEIPKN